MSLRVVIINEMVYVVWYGYVGSHCSYLKYSLKDTGYVWSGVKSIYIVSITNKFISKKNCDESSMFSA